MEATKINKKKLILVCVAVLILIVLAVLRFIPHEQGYRIISISELLGGVIAEDKGVLYSAYPNMHLYEGHALTTETDSFARMVLDGDKYVKLEEESRAAFAALGKPGSGKTVINLERGVLTNELTKPLKADESYVVNTPNAVLAVRGTFFRVEVIPQQNGDVLTEVYTYGGSVACSRVLPDGKLIDEQVIIDKGYKTAISMDKIETVYIVEEIIPEKENTEPIYMEDVSDSDLAEMYEASSHGHELFMTTDEIWEHIEEREMDINEYRSQYDQTPLEPHKSQQAENSASSESVNTSELIEQEQQDNESDVVNEPENEDVDTDDIAASNTQIEQENTAVELPALPEEIPAVEQKPAENIPEQLPDIVEPPQVEEEEPEDDDSDSDSDSNVTVGGGSGGGGGGAGQTHTHTEVTTTTDATCTTDGSEVVTCSTCGETISTTVIPATRHTEGTPEIINATCTTEGSRIVRCSNCNTVLENEVLPITHTGEICTCGAVKISAANFPDPKFMEYVQVTYDNNDNDGYLDSDILGRISGVTLDNSYSEIKKLTGIELFSNLTSLTASNVTNLESLDVSANTALQSITLYNSKVSSLDVSSNTNLQILMLAGTGLTSLNLGNNDTLQTLRISNSGLTDVDISSNTNLRELTLSGNSNLTRVGLANDNKHQSLNLYFTNNAITDFSFLDSCNILSVYISKHEIEKLNPAASRVEINNCSFAGSSTEFSFSNNNALKILVITGDTTLTKLNLSGSTNLERVESSSIKIIDLRNTTFAGNVDLTSVTSLTTVYTNGSSWAGGTSLSVNNDVTVDTTTPL